VYNVILEVPIEVYAPLEDNFLKISKDIQGFHVNIVYLEVCTTPATPPKEMEQREKTVMMTVESIKILEECAKLYEESTQVWT
jgi:hypothetical protein